MRQKQTIVAIRVYLQTKSPKLITEIMQLLTKKGAAPDRAMLTLES